jgi:glucokinase
MAGPSVVDRASGKILDAFGKYADAMEIDLPAWSRETLNLPLAIENDARAALIGEWKAGAGKGCDDLVMVTLGTGIGSAAVMEGKVLRGKHGQAGILGGHLSIQFNGRPCSCGNVGCAEAHASTAVLPTLAREHELFSGSRLREEATIDYATVLQLASEGDRCAMALRQQAIDVWSAAIVNLIHAYDPQRVVVGGGIAAGAASFLPALRQNVSTHAHTPWGQVEIVAAQLGDDAALVGCDFLLREGL